MSDEHPTLTDINDAKGWALWVLTHDERHDCIRYDVSPPFTCESCPWGATPRERAADIANDPSEAHYNCPVLKKEVWGEQPECGEHQNKLLESILKDAADWPAYERARAEKLEQRRQKQQRRAEALSRLSDWDVDALGLHLSAEEKAARALRKPTT